MALKTREQLLLAKVESAYGTDSTLQTGQYVEISFPVEIAGSGAAGTSPGYSVLLEGCGFDETINASTSVVFAPNSDSTESLTLYFWQSGQLHKVTGARGTFTMSLSPGEIPVFNFTFTGLYNAPSTTAEDAR